MNTAITHLHSGGLITNYFCTSSCAHCTYFSGPGWDKDYINSETVEDLLRTVRKLGCSSLHIGGGEPLLRPVKLMETARAFHGAGVSVEYVETNCSWFKNKEEAVELLNSLMNSGIRTLLVSISPFHNEFIPLKKTLGVLDACRETGMGIFPWMDHFLKDLNRFPSDTTHGPDEYLEVFGDDYIRTIPDRYWISLRGRALQTYKPYIPSRSPEVIFQENPGRCRELFDVSHFHVDLYGNYIPGLCTGLSIKSVDLGSDLDRELYPCIARLMTGGIFELTEYAAGTYGFEMKESYAGKCDLCYEIRKYLVLEKNLDLPDLQPAAYYRQN